LGVPWYRWFLSRVIDGVSYFPTPLLEALLEWIVLFVVLLWRKKNIDYPVQVWVWFLGGYGLMRFFAEFLRTPDIQVGYLLGTSLMTLGHIFSIIMMLFALVLGRVLRKK
jgi:phosphatidylglycerol:prolipoprotein diacylglycerol transferase